MDSNDLELKVNDKTQGSMRCSCTLSNVKLTETERIGDLVNKMLEGRRYGKAIMKLEIDFCE